MTRPIFSTYFLKINVKFHENLSSGSRTVPCGQTERQVEANFDVLLAVHLSILLVINQLDAQNLVL